MRGGVPHRFGSHQPERPRKLLLHKFEIRELEERINKDHLTVLPLSIYFLDGRAKVELALAKGRRKEDKRQAIAERDAAADIRKALGRQRKGITG